MPGQSQKKPIGNMRRAVRRGEGGEQFQQAPNQARIGSKLANSVECSLGLRFHVLFPIVQPQSQGILEFFGRDACHFERASQSAKGNLPVHGDDAAALALRRDFLEDGMAAALAIHEKSESLQSLGGLRAGHDGQFSHVPIQTCGWPLAS